MRGVSLQEISDTTKISVRFLEALESEDFTKLPGGIFTRSFLRSYATYLGLDQDRVLSEFQMLAPAKDAGDISRISTANRAQPLTPKRTPVLPWLFSAAMLAGGYLLYHYGHAPAATPVVTEPAVQTTAAAADTTSNSSPSTQIPPAAGNADQTQVSGAPPAESTAAPAPASTAPQADSGATPPGGTASAKPAAGDSGAAQNPSGLAGGKTQAVSQTQDAAAAGAAKNDASANAVLGQGDLTLQVAATERTWVAIECDGKTLLQRTLNPNEVRTLHAHDSFSVTTGNAMGVVLTFNGQTLGPLGRRGEVKTVQLTRPNFKESQP